MPRSRTMFSLALGAVSVLVFIFLFYARTEMSGVLEMADAHAFDCFGWKQHRTCHNELLHACDCQFLLTVMLCCLS